MMKHRIFSAVLAAGMLLFAGTAHVNAADKQEVQTSLIADMPLSTAIEAPYTNPYVYQSMAALQESYPEGMEWTNDNYYGWNGGIYSGGYGCVGFAFLLSDAAFGDLPAAMYETFEPEKLRTGDIIRMNGHSVIVLEVTTDSVIIAEGNYNSSIHWGREITFDEIASDGFEHWITRYPEGIALPFSEAGIVKGVTGTIPVISRDEPAIVWESSDPEIAAVSDSGEITGVSYGIAEITGTCGEQSVTFWVEVTGGIYGDVDLDGTLGVTDVVLMQKHLLNLEPLNAEQVYMGDLYGDGAVDAFDLAALKRLITEE